MECVEFEASLEKLGGATVPVKKLQLATTYSTKSQNHLHMCTMGFPGASDGKASACNVGDPSSIPGLGRSPWKRTWQPTSVFSSGKFHGQRESGGPQPDTTEWLTHTSTWHLSRAIKIAEIRGETCNWNRKTHIHLIRCPKWTWTWVPGDTKTKTQRHQLAFSAASAPAVNGTAATAAGGKTHVYWPGGSKPARVWQLAGTQDSARGNA